ncbi:MAG: FAD-dependent oxidoreductase, partial [Anaerolineae bacterium]|nr:FAD-dependent oxidoreductase [Anaerolineae bacterium]
MTATLSSLSTIQETLEVPIVAEADVVVAGGGCAGVAAALAAARGGAKTILIEQLYALGGTMTAGLMNVVSLALLDWPKAVNEMMDRLLSQGLALPVSPQFRRHPNPPPILMVDPEGAKAVLSQMLREAGVEVLLGTMLVEAIVEGDAIRAAIIENKAGRQAIAAKVFIDATGDGDLAARAGARYELGRGEDSYGSSATLVFRLGGVDLEPLVAYIEAHPDEVADFEPHEVREAIFGHPPKFIRLHGFKGLIERVAKTRQFTDWEWSVLTQRGGVSLVPLPIRGQCHVNRTRITHLTGLDSQALSKGVEEGRRQVEFLFDFMRTYLPGFTHAHILETASLLGVRESRRILGEYVLSREDIEGLARHEDVIVRTYDGLEIHNPTGSGTLFTEIPAGQWYDIPYRCIVVKDLTNCFVAGRCYSTTHEALSAARCIGICMALGEAAGTAAA